MNKPMFVSFSYRRHHLYPMKISNHYGNMVIDNSWMNDSVFYSNEDVKTIEEEIKSQLFGTVSDIVILHWKRME